MNTLTAVAWLASPDEPASVLLQAPEPLADGDRALQLLTLLIVAVLVALAVRTVGQAVAPVIELARSFVATSIATLLILAALVVAFVVAVGYA
ncbi:MAG: hypothetical protein GEV12_03920 [Micromonosporaceae bacterium]|nr:hypothetical protein [Micromonosporaceae bacterium]